MDFRRKAGVVLFISTLLFASLSLFAQSSPNGKLAGVVTDQTGATVKDAQITVTNEATGTKYTMKSAAEGTFFVPDLGAGMYTVEVEAQGFSKAVYQHVKIDAAQEYSLTAVVKVGAATETVEVQAGAELVSTTKTEVSNTVNTRQVVDLPLNGRGVIALLGTQANVTQNGKGNTSIAGSLPSWSQVTMDGINIQDIFIRTNALDFIPNRPSTEAIEEFTVTQGAQDADAALGANAVRMVTRSGGNAYHGKAYEFNRNSAAAANTWFNNNSGVKIPFLNRNEYGAQVGGPIKKNKLFFFVYYDTLRNHQGSPLNQTIPVHDDYLQGQFRYVRPSDNTVQSVNVLTMLAGQNVTIDPKIASAFISRTAAASNVNNFNVGDSKSNQLLNTAGFTRNQGANTDRDVWGGKIDFDLTSKHHFDFVGQHVHETTLRNDLDPINLTPLVTNNNISRLYVGSWRWTMRDNLINTFRMGSNYSQAPFDSSYKNTDGFLFCSGTSTSCTGVSNSGGRAINVFGAALSDTQVFFQPQGRIPTVHQYMDDATWVKGAHTFTFGGQFQKQNVDSYDFGIDPYLIPMMVTGYGAAAPASAQLSASNFPGGSISSTDLGKANNLRAFLGGIIQQINQQYYVTSRTSGFVPGARNDRNLTLNDLMFYGEDKWRIKPNLTLNYGVKWEYLSPYKEINGLQLTPVWEDKSNPVTTLLDPNATVNFANQLYNPDYNNFGPIVGLAWDPFKNGKTVIRAGYSMTYVNDDTFRAAGNASDGNAGLGSTAQTPGFFQTLSSNPTLTTPTFKMPRTLSDQLGVATTSALFGIDPNVKIPTVHEISFGVQRELGHGYVVETRYVGTLGHGLVRGIDYNQTNAGINQAFLTDFQNARNNGYAAVAAGKPFNPTFNPAIPGSVPTPYFNALGPNQGLFSNQTVIADLQQNQVGALADFYVANRSFFPNAPTDFLPNPNIYAADLIGNYSWSSYHSGVVELKKRYSNGLQLQSNYTWSKLLTDSPADTGQTRFDAFLDNARKGLEKAPSDFDLRQVWKMNAIYDMPFGRGKMFFNGANGVLDRIIGGWQLSGIWSMQSGAPFSILSNRGTFNRGGRSGFQTAVSTLSQGQLANLMNFSIASNGNVYWLNPSITDTTTGRAVGPDTQSEAAASTFNQVLFNPGAGQVGNLGLNAFNGPMFMNLDMGLSKQTKITERVGLQLRADAFNLPNHPVFFEGNQEINSQQFGRITSTGNSSRKLQFGARLTF